MSRFDNCTVIYTIVNERIIAVYKFINYSHNYKYITIFENVTLIIQMNNDNES